MSFLTIRSRPEIHLAEIKNAQKGGIYKLIQSNVVETEIFKQWHNRANKIKEYKKNRH